MEGLTAILANRSPPLQMKAIPAREVAVNAEAALEREADRMGAAAVHCEPPAEARELGIVQRMNAPAGAAAAAPAWAPAAAPSRAAAEDFVTHRGAPTYVAVEPWQSGNFPPPNGKLRMTFAGTVWPELEAHSHWGPGTRWWNSASPLTLKRGAASLGHVTAGHALEVGARAQIHAGAAADGLMALLQRRDVPTVTAALGQALQAEAAVAGTRVAARGDATTLLYGDGWLPKARWDNGVEATIRAVLVVPAPPAAVPAAAVVAVPAAAAAALPAAAQPQAGAGQPVPAAVAGQPGP